MKKQISNLIKIIVVAIIIILFRQTQVEAVKWNGKTINSDGDLQSLVVSGSLLDGDPAKLVGAVLPSLGNNTINKPGGICVQNRHFTGYSSTIGYKVSSIIDLNNFDKNTIAKPGDFISYKSSKDIKKYTMKKLGSVKNEYHKVSYTSRNIPSAGHGVSTLGYLMYAARNDTRNDSPTKFSIAQVYWLDQSKFIKSGIIKNETYTGSDIWEDRFNRDIAIVKAGDDYANSSATYNFSINNGNKKSNGSVRTATFTKYDTTGRAYATYNSENGYTYIGPYALRYNYKYANNDLNVVGATVTEGSLKVKGYTNKRNSTDIKSFKNLEKDETFYIVIKGKLTDTLKLQIKIRNPVIKARMIFLVGRTIYEQNLLIYQGQKGYTYDAITIPMKGTPDSNEIEINIKKVDSNTLKAITGAAFTIKNTETGKYIDENGKESDTPKEIATDSNGYIKISKVPKGTYEATETKVPAGYKATSETVKIVNDGVTIVKNEPEGGNGEGLIKLIKNTNAPLEGIKFGIKDWEPDDSRFKKEPTKPDKSNYQKAVPCPGESCSQYGTAHSHGTTLDTEAYNKAVEEYEYLKEGYEYWKDSQVNYKAIATSDKEGKVKFTGFRTDGSYTVYEIEIPNPYFQTNDLPKVVLTGYRDTTNSNIYNERKYIDIEGTVFLDGRDGKQNIRNNVYDQEEGFNGVKVTLKRNGQVVANVSSGYDSDGSSTGIAGHYKFLGDINHLKIDAQHLNEYTIEFEYNGLKYESVAQTSIEPGASSKAKEKETEREAFNTRYSTVTANTKIANGQSTNKAKGGDIIRYKSEPHTSEVIYQTSAKDDKGNAYDNVGYADEQYHITSYTTEAGLDLSTPNKEGGYPYDPAKDSIVDINFGIYEREHPDVAISADLDTAETSINGYTQIYPYQKRYGQIGDDSAFTVEVKESDTYYPSYQRRLYKSDVQYTQGVNDGSELAIYLTYKVSIKNQSSSINVTVNDIVDYFTKDVTGGIVAVGKTPNTLAEIPAKTNSNRYQLTDPDGIQYSSMEEDSGYSKQYITLNKEIRTGDKYEFYVQYKMTLDAIRKTIDEDVKFNNVFELNTVSAKTDDEIWTAVDMDSAVGNCVPSDIQTMEDDTDYAPGINITTKSEDVRQITGIVFEDQTSTELKVGQERNGNGQYDQGEKGVPNAVVQLLDVDREGQIAYTVTDGTNVKTGSDGNYTLSGFIPGNYIIKYTYGNGTDKYTAQQYKSTIYVDQARANENYANGYRDGVDTGNKYWYLNEVDARKSDAVDNYSGEIKTLYNIPQATINEPRTEIEKKLGYNDEDKMQHILNGTNIDNTISIDAYTPRMGLKVKVSDSQEDEPYVISNVDFGIAERARYKVQIDKVVNRIQLVQPDGSILRDFTSYDKDKLPENTTLIPSQRGISRGYIKFEIDAEILQTPTLLVEYGFKVTNISEVEYVDEAYYKYGVVPQDKDNKIVKLSIVNILDYVDNELQYTENSHMITEGKTDITNKSNGWSTINLLRDGNKYVSQDVLKALYDEKENCAYNTILISNGLDNKMLKPEESAEIALSLNKTLSPKQDEMRYENLTEVVEVKKAWGRELSMEETTTGAGDGQKLGNFDPVKDPDDDSKIIKVKDPDTNYSETIIILPPTGADKNSIILYTSIGIVALAILAAGVIIIKKKVQK